MWPHSARLWRLLWRNPSRIPRRPSRSMAGDSRPILTTVCHATLSFTTFCHHPFFALVDGRVPAPVSPMHRRNSSCDLTSRISTLRAAKEVGMRTLLIVDPYLIERGLRTLEVDDPAVDVAVAGLEGVVVGLSQLQPPPFRAAGGGDRQLSARGGGGGSCFDPAALEALEGSCGGDRCGAETEGCARQRRRLNAISGAAAAEEAWHNEWRRRLRCWWMALPTPAQGRLQGAFLSLTHFAHMSRPMFPMCLRHFRSCSVPRRAWTASGRAPRSAARESAADRLAHSGETHCRGRMRVALRQRDASFARVPFTRRAQILGATSPEAAAAVGGAPGISWRRFRRAANSPSR